MASEADWAISHIPIIPFLRLGREMSARSPLGLQDPVAEQGSDVVGTEQSLLVQEVN